MALISEVRTNHMSTLLSSLEDMMKSEVMCDFTIKVDNDDYPAHRVVLAGSSKYYKAMFSSGMKEAKEGFVQMFGTKTTAMKRSIDFMYTGTAEIEFQTVENTLSAATLLQLDSLAELCFHFLETNIEVDSCLQAVRLSNVYGHESLKESAEKFLVEHFVYVVDEPNFPEIPIEDLMRYIKSSDAGHELSWMAVVAWMKDDFDSKKQLFPELLGFLKIQEFPFELFEVMVLNEPLLENSDELKAMSVTQWFSDFATFEGNLSSESYYGIKSLIQSSNVPNEQNLVRHLAQYLVENFKILSGAEDFLEINFEEILPVYQSRDRQHFSEQVKWIAAANWVNHDESRIELFPVLFDSIKLDLLPRRVIEREIPSNPLVKESQQCKDTLLKHLCANTNPASHITFLSQQRGEIMTFDPIENKCDVLLTATGGIGITSLNGYLYLVTPQGFYRLNHDGEWTTLPSPPNTVESTSTVLSFRQRVYVIGNLLQWFDPLANAWLQPCFTCGWSVRNGACFTASEDALYQLGCNDSPTAAWIINADTHFCNHSWTQITSMHYRHISAAAAVLRRAVWVIGGGHKSVETYHPVLNTWIRMPEMVLSRNALVSCVINSKLYAIGGSENSSSAGFGGIASGNTFLEGDSIESCDATGAKWTIVQTSKRLSGRKSCCSYSPPPNVAKLVGEAFNTPIQVSGFTFGTSAFPFASHCSN